MTIANAQTAVYRNFVNGEWVESNSEKYYKVYNPANIDELVGEFPVSTEDDVNEAVIYAHKAFQTWRKVPASRRAEYIYKFIDLLDENAERIGKALSKEQGKPLKEAVGEAKRGVNEMRFVAGEAVRLDGTTLPSDRENVVNVTERVPIGVVAAITPWNFPVLTPLRKMIPALISGCTVVLKPATDTPLTSILLTELLEKTGLPQGTVNLIIGKGRTVGDALVSHHLIKGVSFTGSTQVGQKIYETAAKNFSKVQLELGGKNPGVVAEYNDLEDAATQIVGSAFTNCGQRCTSISRVIVLEKHANELEKHILDKVKQFKVGNGMDPDVQLGPVVNQDALETLEGYMELANQEGAEIALGGERLTGDLYDKGHYFAPTVIKNVKPEMRIAKEEIFGPILVILRVQSFDEAIEVSNSTQYGLTASVFTDRMDWAYRFKDDVESGMIHINNGTNSEGHMPFGGVKNSGVGPYSIGDTNKDFYTELKVTYIQHKN